LGKNIFLDQWSKTQWMVMAQNKPPIRVQGPQIPIQQQSEPLNTLYFGRFIYVLLDSYALAYYAFDHLSRPDFACPAGHRKSGRARGNRARLTHQTFPQVGSQVSWLT
jgi:hypothetical protein